MKTLFIVVLIFALTSCSNFVNKASEKEKVKSVEKYEVSRARFTQATYGYPSTFVFSDVNGLVHVYKGNDLKEELSLAEKGDSIFVYLTIASNKASTVEDIRLALKQ